MIIPDHILNLIKVAYRDPQFCVERDGDTSIWKSQLTGIRQGCPFPPICPSFL